MRLPLTAQLSTKDGVSNKNARMTNTLKESGSSGDLACVRPGLRELATTTGNGHGLVNFNGELISVYGSTIGQQQWYDLRISPNYFIEQSFGYSNVVVLNGEYVMLSYNSPNLSTWKTTDGDWWEFETPNVNSLLLILASDATTVVAPYDFVYGTFRWYTSTDGVTWVFHSTTYPNQGYVSYAFGACHVKGKFYVMDYSRNLFTSSDGLSWAHQTVSISTSFITPFSDKGVLISSFGSCIWSEDGDTWGNEVDVYDDYTAPSMWAASDDLLIGLSTDALYPAVWVSNDGTEFTRHTPNLLGRSPASITYDGNVFLILDQTNITSPVLMQSSDGVTWREVSTLDQTATLRCTENGVINAPPLAGNPSNGGSTIYLDVLRYRPLATLDDSFYDFAQSTL